MIAGPFAESSTSLVVTHAPPGDDPSAHARIPASASVNVHRPRCCATRNRRAPNFTHRCPTT